MLICFLLQRPNQKPKRVEGKIIFPSLRFLILLAAPSWHTLLYHPYPPGILRVRVPWGSVLEFLPYVSLW